MPTRCILASLLSGLDVVSFTGDADTEVSGIAYDSRQVNNGDVFVAVPGFVHDGIRFVPEAIEAGATAIVAEVAREDVELSEAPAVWVQVADARATLAPMAAAFYGYPSREMTVVGITGTNGKTTVTALVEAILSSRGPVGRWSTTTVSVAGVPSPAHRTTPEGPELQKVMREMVDAECWAAAIEVSSHALRLHRVDATGFAAAVFTNLTTDHLDFHASFDDYLDAKALLFERLEIDGVAVLNLDDPAALKLAKRTRARVVGFGWKKQRFSSAKLRELLDSLDAPAGKSQSAPDLDDGPEKLDVPTYLITEWAHHGIGSKLRLETPEGELTFESPLFGPANGENLAAAIALTMELGLSVREIAAPVARFAGAPGRFQRVLCGQPFSVLVDFAHTPDALRAALAAARALAGPHRVFVVFGAGGDRDHGKRPMMGRFAAVGADQVFITADNPRSEDPEAIIDDVASGIPVGTTAQIERQVDRRVAIEQALARARPGDCVLLAGKGHETEQVFADRSIEFNDVAIAAEWLEKNFTAATDDTESGS